MRGDAINICERALLEVGIAAAEALGSVIRGGSYSVAFLPGSHFYSRVFDLRPAPGGEREAADALKADIERGKAPNNVLIRNADLSADMERAMFDAGFDVFKDQTGMMCDLSRSVPPNEVEVTVQPLERMAEWASCVNTAIGKDDDARIFEALWRRPETRFYAVENEGRIVSTVMLAVFGGIACLHEGGTYPEFRKRGYISALLLKGMTDARAMGFGEITLQASAMGRPVYEELGFEDIGRLRHWYLPKE